MKRADSLTAAAKRLADARTEEASARADLNIARRELRTAHSARQLAAITEESAGSPPLVAALLQRAAIAAYEADIRVADAHASRDHQALNCARLRTANLKSHARQLRARQRR